MKYITKLIKEKKNTKTFQEVFPTPESFAECYTTCGIPCKLQEDGEFADCNIKTVYYMLNANYANHHIDFYDESQFKNQVMTIIFEAGPAWQKAMSVQKKLLEFTVEEEDKQREIKRLVELLYSLDDTLISRFVYRFKKLFTEKNEKDALRAKGLRAIEIEIRKNVAEMSKKGAKAQKQYADGLCLKYFGNVEENWEECYALIKLIVDEYKNKE